MLLILLEECVKSSIRAWSGNSEISCFTLREANQVAGLLLLNREIIFLKFSSLSKQVIGMNVGKFYPSLLTGASLKEELSSKSTGRSDWKEKL